MQKFAVECSLEAPRTSSWISGVREWEESSRLDKLVRIRKGLGIVGEMKSECRNGDRKGERNWVNINRMALSKMAGLICRSDKYV